MITTARRRIITPSSQRHYALFNGSSSKIQTNYSSSGTSTFSFSWRMYLTDTGSRNTIVSDHRNASGDDFTLFIEKEADNDLNIAIGNNNGSYSQSQVSISNYLNKWSRFTIAINGTMVVVYADDTQIHSFTSTIAFGSTNTSNYYLGTLGQRSALYFNGKLDDVRFYNKYLSSGEVANLPSNGLVAHYKLDGNANDETGNYHGIATDITYEIAA